MAARAASVALARPAAPAAPVPTETQHPVPSEPAPEKADVSLEVTLEPAEVTLEPTEAELEPEEAELEPEAAELEPEEAELEPEEAELEPEEEEMESAEVTLGATEAALEQAEAAMRPAEPVALKPAEVAQEQEEEGEGIDVADMLEPEAPVEAQEAAAAQTSALPAPELQQPAAPAPQQLPASDEATRSGVWALDGSQPKARPAEEPSLPVEEVAAEARRPPVDMGELPPAPEEPLQLASTWEFMGMAEVAHAGHSTEPVPEERGLELDTAVPPMPEYTGAPQDEVALASAWDFVPQWQPGQPEPPSEGSAPSTPPSEHDSAAPVSTAGGGEPVTAEADATASTGPATTGKYGVLSAEPEPLEAQESAHAQPTTAEDQELPSVDVDLEHTRRFGSGLPARSSTGKYGIEPAAEGKLSAEEVQEAESSWVQMFADEKQAGSGAAASEPPAAPLEAAEPDPFAEFAAEAEAAKAKEAAPSKPEEQGEEVLPWPQDDGAGSKGGSAA
jgi:hypothetical protein